MKREVESKMYQKGQILDWAGRKVVVDTIWTYRKGNEFRFVGKVREMDENHRMALFTEDINFLREFEKLRFAGQIPVADYYETVTRCWHETSPDTQGYQVCSMEEATHVVFCSEGLEMAAGDGQTFTPGKVYPIKEEEESGDYLIIDDTGQVLIGFDLFIPCEYLKEKTTDKGKPASNQKGIKSESDNVIPFTMFNRRTR